LSTDTFLFANRPQGAKSVAKRQQKSANSTSVFVANDESPLQEKPGDAKVKACFNLES